MQYNAPAKLVGTSLGSVASRPPTLAPRGIGKWGDSHRAGSRERPAPNPAVKQSANGWRRRGFVMQCLGRCHLLTSTIAYSIDGACITDTPALEQLQLRELASLDMITKGQGNLQEWCDMDAAVRLCRNAALKGVGPEALESCQKAHEALQQAQRRATETGRLEVSGEGIKALRDVLEYADLQRRSIGRAEFEAVIKATLREARC